MMLLILKALFFVFVFSSILHGITIWLGRSLEAADSDVEKITVAVFGFHTKASIEKFVQPKYRQPAVLFLRLRNWSLILFLILSLLEYLLR